MLNKEIKLLLLVYLIYNRNFITHKAKRKKNFKFENSSIFLLRFSIKTTFNTTTMQNE